MKRFFILTLCIAAVIALLASCEGEDDTGYSGTSGTEISQAASENETEIMQGKESESASETEGETQKESDTKKQEQTMGIIQEMIPKTD